MYHISQFGATRPYRPIFVVFLAHRDDIDTRTPARPWPACYQTHHDSPEQLNGDNRPSTVYSAGFTRHQGKFITGSFRFCDLRTESYILEPPKWESSHPPLQVSSWRLSCWGTAIHWILVVRIPRYICINVRRALPLPCKGIPLPAYYILLSWKSRKSCAKLPCLCP